MVLLNRPDDGARGQIPRDGPPGPAQIGTLEEIGREIPGLVGVGGGIQRSPIVERGFDIVDKGKRRKPGQRGRPGPAPAPVSGNLYQTIVGSHDQHPGGDR